MGSSEDVKVAEDKHNPGSAEKSNKTRNNFKRRNANRKNRNSNMRSNNFKGKCKDLEEHVFDANRFNQADEYMKTLNEICEYVGSNFEKGSDIKKALKEGKKPTFSYPDEPSNTKMKKEKKLINIQVNLKKWFGKIN